ncbi:hypothetical protein K8N75_05810 [Methanobacterium sp. VT]|uniref:Uncharacterized protein n=2 Tax=Methanobacterium spitsbergense TaxID=2874285 RepID=A0A8T5UPI2_9EURY|nr:hypothetical protein [Methanobacterium spitsbergense]
MRNRENYCPSCGMELSVPYSKSLKEKYIAGEYQDHQEEHIIRKNNRTETEYRPRKDTNDYEQYDDQTLEEYETKESGSSGIFTVTFLFLIMALLFGFVIGMIIFSGIFTGISKI